MEIIVKKYEHFNRAFKNWDTPKGKYIRTKAQYNETMAREGMVPYDKAVGMVNECVAMREKNTYKISNKAKSLINSVVPDRKGNVKLSDRQIEGMKEVGVKFNVSDYALPKHYSDKGGFSAT